MPGSDIGLQASYAVSPTPHPSSQKLHKQTAVVKVGGQPLPHPTPASPPQLAFWPIDITIA